MRVIAGKARRMTLVTPSGRDVRPTTDRIKETLFNILQNDLADCAFLDLFSGSGGIGIEALSRGAKKAVFVDKNKESVRCIEQNLSHTRLRDDAEVLPMDVLQAIRNLSRRNKLFDIVFMDPPYECGMEKNVLDALASAEIIDGNTIIVVETSLRTDVDNWNDGRYEVIRIKRYKTNCHAFLRYICQDA